MGRQIDAQVTGWMKEEFMASPDAAIARRDEDMIRTTKVRHIKK